MLAEGCFKKWIAFTVFAVMLIAYPAIAFAAEAEELEIQAEVAVLMDGDTGQVLYSKDAERKMYPASITKILTGLLVLESLEPDHTLTASGIAVDIPYWGSSAYLEEGETLTVDEAMYAMMLRSGNDAANVLAEEVGGSLSGFSTLMNERAAGLGAMDTHFTNPHGLPDRRHYTTAYDMAVITQAAIGTPGFMQYFGGVTYTMSATNLFGERMFTNTHKMLRENLAQYSADVVGGKTGYTMAAENTLVTMAQRDGRTLICVVQKSDTIYADTAELLDLGFERYQPYTYELHNTASIEVPVISETGAAGKAVFEVPQQVPLLLYQDVNPEQVVEEYHFPEQVQTGEAAEAAVSLQAADELPPGLPSVVYSMVIPASIELDRTPIPLSASAPEEADNESRLWGNHRTVFLAGCIAAFLLVLMIVIIVLRCVRYRRRRRKSRYRSTYMASSTVRDYTSNDLHR